LLVAAPAQLVRDVGRYVLRRAFRCVEANDPHRVFVSSTKKICDESNIRDQFGVICLPAHLVRKAAA
jgi:hypothetical protein